MTILEMILFNLLALYCVVSISIQNCESKVIDLKFPEDFLIGTATSAYQVEGAWNVDGKQESNWDHFVHSNPERVLDKSNGDISCDFYHKYKEDIQLMKHIGFNHHRFSLSWSRILPTGETNYINRAGIDYYHRVLDELEKQGIIPFVTIYHWDHPQILERFGGWLNEKMAFIFADYARLVFKEFGHRVKFFSTINEPYINCIGSYRDALYAPGYNLSGYGEYECLQNMLKAHALAYHIYDEEFRAKQNGQIGIVVPAFYYFNKYKSDSLSSEIAFEFEVGWTANPIFSKTGDYPNFMKGRIADRSRLQGYNTSRLPVLTKEWVDYIRGTADYFGLNHYTSRIVTPLPYSQILTWPSDEGLQLLYDPNWQTSEASWLKLVPEGLRLLLNKIKDKYDNPPVYIMENGVADGNGTNDVFRVNYLNSYMKAMLTAIKQDKCNVKAYTIWSFLDSYEWNYGYTDHFGLVQVDFNDPNRKRTPKKSVSWLKNVLASRKLQSSDNV